MSINNRLYFETQMILVKDSEMSNLSKIILAHSYSLNIWSLEEV